MRREAFGTMVKLLPCDLKITDSSHRNSLLQCKIKLCTINHFLRFHVDRSFMHRTVLFFLMAFTYLFEFDCGSGIIINHYDGHNVHLLDTVDPLDLTEK